MPYRRLPNTDSARLRSLRSIVSSNMDGIYNENPVAADTFYKISTLLPSYESAIINMRSNQSDHLNKNKEYPHLLRKSRLYISHFIQVLNMSIARGEIKPAARNFFGLSDYGARVPELNSESDILSWGKALIKGEAERTRQGATPLSNPSIALLKVWYEKFEEANYYKNTYLKNAARNQQNIIKLRKEADDLILKTWNEIESFYGTLPEATLRMKASKWGVVYVFRPYERERIEAMKNQPQLF